MNLISGKVATSTTWTLKFADSNNKEIASKIINPWSGAGSQTYSFSNIGRFLTLRIDEQELKFHTIRSGIAGYDADKLSVELPKNNLTINFNGVEIAKIENIHMPNESEVDINQDFNKITCDYSSSPTETISITGNNHVFRHYEDSAATVSPIFNISEKFSEGRDTPTAPIVEWEYHLRNTTNSADGVTPVVPGHRINLRIPTVNSVKVKGANYFYKVIGLTDQMYVDPGKTNVYAFRADMHQSARIVTYSLAYVYSGGRPPL